MAADSFLLQFSRLKKGRRKGGEIALTVPKRGGRPVTGGEGGREGKKVKRGNLHRQGESMKERRDCATIKHAKVVFVQKQRQQLRFAVRWGIIYVGLKKSWSSPSPFPPPPPSAGQGKRGGGEERRPNFGVSEARPPPDEQGRPSPPPSPRHFT